jgi:hypothetical protein
MYQRGGSKNGGTGRYHKAILVLAPVAYALLNNNIDLAKYQSTTAQNLTETGPDK